MRPSEVYNSYKNGSTPEPCVVLDDKDSIKKIVSNSQRNDTVLVQNIEEDKFKCIRIIPEYQSRNSAMMESFKNPNAGFSKDFEYCSYQLLRVSIPTFRGDDAKSVRPSDVHRYLHWNQKEATRRRTARSPKNIQRAWEQY